MLRSTLPAMIVVLALIDASIHLALDVVFFRGQFFTGVLNILFLLNFAGYVFLASGFVVSRRWSNGLQRVVSLALLAYALSTLVAWMLGGQDDLLGLGYVSKATELALVLALVLQLKAQQAPRVRPVLVLVPRGKALDNT